MTNPHDRDQETKLREAELKARERELRLRELELEIHQSQQASRNEIHSPEPPLYQTKKHQSQENSIQKIANKLVKFAKFAGFMVAGIAIIKAGFFVGMWLTYLILAGIMAAVGYQIFLKDD